MKMKIFPDLYIDENEKVDAMVTYGTLKGAKIEYSEEKRSSGDVVKVITILESSLKMCVLKYSSLRDEFYYYTVKKGYVFNQKDKMAGLDNCFNELVKN